MKICCPPCAVYFHEGAGVPRGPASCSGGDARRGAIKEIPPRAQARRRLLPRLLVHDALLDAGRRRGAEGARRGPKGRGRLAVTRPGAPPPRSPRVIPHNFRALRHPHARRGALQDSPRRRGPARLDRIRGPWSSRTDAGTSTPRTG